MSTASNPVLRPLTPIQHLVVILDDGVSFDHYFGTYPNATNTDGTAFQAASGTPRVNGLTSALSTQNPNEFNPQRLSHSQALTCAPDESYLREQQAYDAGKADKFEEYLDRDVCTGQPIVFGEPGLVMDYFDGNTVTGLWNYAQHYALNDESFNSSFGPATVGALNLVSGQTHGAYAVNPVTGARVTDSGTVASPNADGVGTVIADPDPAFDDCSDNNHTATAPLAAMTGRNIGDLMNAAGVTWGWFQGGFRPTGTANGYTICGQSHTNIGGNTVVDYSPHDNPFAYYASTSNPKHLPPSSPAAIGTTDQANHNYDLTDFSTALQANNLPAVSLLKAAQYQNGHAGYSDPLDEQTLLVNTINELESSPAWSTTAIVIAYGDSGGWYDHVSPPIINGSNDPAHDDPTLCGKGPAAGGYQDRCGYGPRTPLLIVSPYSRVNFVDHTPTNLASVLQFIEDNWRLGRIGNFSYDSASLPLYFMFDFLHRPHLTPVLLNPNTGSVATSP